MMPHGNTYGDFIIQLYPYGGCIHVLVFAAEVYKQLVL